MNFFKNTFKILAEKFSVVWATLLYFFVAAVIIVSIVLSVFLPYIKLLTPEDFGVVNAAVEVLKQLSNGNFSAFADSFRDLWREVASGLGSRAWATSFLLFGVLAVSRFIFGFADYATYDIIHEHMSSAAKLGFMSRFIRSLGNAALFQICKMAISLPFDIGVIVIMYFVSMLANIPALFLLTPFLVMLTAVMLFPLRLTLLGSLAPAMLEHKKNAPAAFVVSLGKLKGNFWRNYVSFISFFLAAIVFNVFFGLFTLTVGLLLTVPITFLFLKILCCVLFKHNSGLRYYVNKDTVVNNSIIDK